jgi:hypothetical protein
LYSIYACPRGRLHHAALQSRHPFATAEFGVLLPAGVAHPPFSTNWPWAHDEVFRSSASFPTASGCCMKLSTQIGVNAATTAACACSFAMLSAVLPVVHPHHEKPRIMIATAPMTAPQNAGFNHCGTHIRDPFVFWEKTISPSAIHLSTRIKRILSGQVFYYNTRENRHGY